MNNNMKDISKNKNNDIKSKYAGLQVRLIASLIDCLLIGLLFLPLFSISSYYIYGDVTPSAVIQTVLKEAEELSLDSKSFDSANFFKNNEQLHNYFIVQHGFIKIILDQSFQFIVLGVTTLIFWIKKQATPGKRLMSLKIVDAETGNKPTKKQLVIRIFSLLISALPAFLGIIWIAIDPKKQAWHDKIAKTLVIKEKT